MQGRKRAAPRKVVQAYWSLNLLTRRLEARPRIAAGQWRHLKLEVLGRTLAPAQDRSGELEQLQVLQAVLPRRDLF